MLTEVQAIDAFGATAVEQRYEQTADDVLLDARHDVDMHTVDSRRVAECPIYRAAVLGSYEAILKNQSALIDSLRKTPSTATHSWGYVDHEGGNSSWVADERDCF